jgi:type IV secretory pathway component VirB8
MSKDLETLKRRKVNNDRIYILSCLVGILIVVCIVNIAFLSAVSTKVLFLEIDKNDSKNTCIN